MSDLKSSPPNGLHPTSARSSESQRQSVSGLRLAANVMHAVILRDIRSRFFNHGLGFLLVPMLPVGHILLLLGIYKTLDRQAPFGDDLVLFFATGLIPALTVIYVSRYMAVSLISNKNMMAFPAVHLLDIILARSALELFGIVISVFMLLVILISLGTDAVPKSVPDAVLALITSAFLGVGIGIVVSVITAIFPFFALIYSLSTALLYLSSDGPIYIPALPEQVIYIASFNPIFHAVEWMRSAYYLGYPTQYLSKGYLIACTVGSLAIGLAMERLLKPQILNG